MKKMKVGYMPMGDGTYYCVCAYDGKVYSIGVTDDYKMYAKIVGKKLHVSNYDFFQFGDTCSIEIF